jgi:hypothetical protein
MNKKQEKIATIALAAFLAAMFCYQVAYGTNESSYKYGYGQGKSEWVNCTDFDADCSDGLSDCHSPVTTYAKNSTSGYYDIRTDHYDIMTNTTACIDGYVHAWNHVCNQKQAKDLAS